jgi:uncharacterized membrane protein
MTGFEQRIVRTSTFGAAVLVVATVTVGLMAGVFGLYANTIMPGLGTTDDRTFVAAFRAIDAAIVNPWFLGFGFVGALVATALAAVLHLRSGRRAVLALTVAALALYLFAFALTLGVHVPLNNGIKAAGDPMRIADIAAVREAFDEARWARWNVVRAVSATAACICLAAALAVRRPR